MNLKPENIIFNSPIREAIYYSIIKCPDNIYRVYSNQWYKTYQVAVIESRDGINFSNVKHTIFKKSGASHNFFPFYGRDKKLYGIGGIDNWKYDKEFHDITGYKSFVTTYESKFKESSKDVKFDLLKHRTLLSSKTVLNHVCGLYLFTSKDGLNWEQVYKSPIITVFNKGYTNAIKLFGKSSEFDGHVNCVYDDLNDEYYIYLRSNVSQGFRFIQYATSKGLKEWSEFKYLFGRHKNNIDNYYTPCMFKYKSLYIGVVPYFNLDNKCCLRILTSHTGNNWYIKKDIFLDNVAFYKGEKPKNTKHFVNGYVETEKEIYFYVHENFYGLNSHKPVTLKRYSILKKDFNEFIY